MMLGMGVWALLLAGAGLALALWGGGMLRRQGGSRPYNEQHHPTPRGLLDERLARGEIDQDEYEAVRTRLDH